MRAASRPSAIARRDGHRNSLDAFATTQVTIPNQQWASLQELPAEGKQEDIGWLPGPVGGGAGRTWPAYTGAPMGPTDASLNSSSTARQVMHSLLLTDTYCSRMVMYATQHNAEWARKHPNPDGVQRAFCASDLRNEHVELWHAIKVRIALLNPAVPARVLWTPSHPLYDLAIDAACPYDVYRYLNRHLSFAAYGSGQADHAESSDSDSSSDGESSCDDADGSAAASGGDAWPTGSYDRFRKRRELSDLARVQMSSSWQPGQFCVLDDIVREDRKGIRIRYKAAVHTGCPCDALSCSATYFFLGWWEKGWDRWDSCTNENRADDSESTTKVLLRAGALLTPHVGHCIFLDRGLGVVSAQHKLRASGCHSFALLNSNRVGLPREFVRQLTATMKCKEDCDHSMEAAQDSGCKRWAYTVVSKGDWELEIVQDGTSSKGSHIILGHSDFFSATRVSTLSRTVAKKILAVKFPEGTSAYNQFGRHGADTGDGGRKRLRLAARRTERRGPKGALFDAEIGFYNGYVVTSFLCGKTRQERTRGLPQHADTVIAFATRYATEVICSVSMRRRVPAHLQPYVTALAVRAPLASPSLETRAMREAHKLINAYARAKAASASGVRVTGRGKSCSINGCKRLPVRPHFWCPGCGAWYHLECYFEVHRCWLKS